MNLKFYSIILFILSSTVSRTYCQENTGSLKHIINIEKYQGKKFRLTAFVKIEPENDSACARIWARIDKATGYGFLELMWNNPIRSKEWKQYKIVGTIDSGGVLLAFGPLSQYNGKFYYDDFMVEVEISKNKWDTIYKEEFLNEVSGGEIDTLIWIPRFNSLLFKTAIQKDDASLQGNSLLMIGKKIPIYGINEKVGKFTLVNGVKLYYEIYGEGQPLLILHGNGGSIKSASAHYPYFLERGYKVIAVDSRAQGKSGDNETELTYDLMASDINELLTQLKVDSVFLWGQSDGAIIGLMMAMKYPEKIKKLVAFAPNITADTSGIEPAIYHYIETQVQKKDNSRQYKLNLLMLKYPNIPLASLKAVKCEVLLMAGDRDFVPLQHILDMYKNIPKSNLCIIPGATHAAAWNKKELFLEITTQFFETPFKMPSTIDWFKE